MHQVALVEHRAREVARAELHTTQLVATELQMEHAARQVTGAVAVVAVRQLPAPMRFLLAATAATDEHPQSPELQQLMQVAVAVAVATRVVRAVHPPLAAMVETVAAETVDHQRGMEHTVAQAPVSAEQQIPAAVAVAAVTALPISAAPLTAAAAMVVQALL